MENKDYKFENIFTENILLEFSKYSKGDIYSNYIKNVLTYQRYPNASCDYVFDKQLRAHKNAWECYIDSASKLRLFEGSDGKDLLNRLTKGDHIPFYGALNECFTAWFVVARLKFCLNKETLLNKKNPDFIIKKMNETIIVEVKTPIKSYYNDKFIYGNNSEKYEKCLKNANSQFDINTKNLLVICPKIEPDVDSDERGYTEAFYGKQVISIPINIHEGSTKDFDESTEYEFQLDGSFLKENSNTNERNFTRTSAVLLLKEIKVYTSLFGKKDVNSEVLIEPNAKVFHNPFAVNPIDPTLFNPLPQYIRKDDKMIWINE